EGGLPVVTLGQRGLEDVAAAALRGLDLENEARVLALAPDLAVVDELVPQRAFDRLAVVDLRLPDVRLEPELPLEPADDDLEVELALAADEVLPGFEILPDLEARVLALEPSEGFVEILLLGGGLGLDRAEDHWFGDLHPGEDRFVLVGGEHERVAGAGELEPDGGRDVADRDRVDLVG